MDNPNDVTGSNTNTKRPSEDDPAVGPTDTDGAAKRHNESDEDEDDSPAAKRPKDSDEGDSQKRCVRLASNRKAARESRRRKKVLVEELQRSVIFFTRANAQVRQKNEGLESMLAAARIQVKAGVDGTVKQEVAASGNAAREPPAATLPAAAAQPDPSVSAAAQAQAMTQGNNQLMANWLAMAQAVPNPMTMQMPMGMFNPGLMGQMGMANPGLMGNMGNPGLMGQMGQMGMAAAGNAGLGQPFLGQLQGSAPAVSNNATGGDGQEGGMFQA